MAMSPRLQPGCKLRRGSSSAAAPLRAGTGHSFLAPDPHPPVRIGYVLQRGCRAPARRVLGRRVRYVIGAEPGQVPGRRWQGPRS
ncbi:tryptophan biosynthesis modulator TrpM [Streptacidiphilus sp. N1-5]|uniref:Tryptophan biosynthesis modulator TrpM n=1 Tax=Streptacidiphilus cavernicola TaxID=3342716 RepID=A0ABV6UQN3_9ACTN